MGDRFDMVLTNPPFGKKSSTTIIGADGKPYKEKETIERDDFWLRDESLEDSENLPDPAIIAREIITDLQDALAQFQAIVEDLGEEDAT